MAVGTGPLNERLKIRTERRRGSGVQSLAKATVPLEPVRTSWENAAAAESASPCRSCCLCCSTRSRPRCGCPVFNHEAPILGEIARIPTQQISNKQRVFEESIDTLRANLMLSKDTAGVRTIAIASSISGEGKSSVASQLAISLAKACGETVLLVDADLRSPDQHDIFGLNMGEGLTRVLQGEAKLTETVDKSLGDFVHVLPAGYLDMSPHRVLNPNALDALISKAKDDYRFVVIDTDRSGLRKPGCRFEDRCNSGVCHADSAVLMPWFEPPDDWKRQVRMSLARIQRRSHATVLLSLRPVLRHLAARLADITTDVRLK